MLNERSKLSLFYVAFALIALGGSLGCMPFGHCGDGDEVTMEYQLESGGYIANEFQYSPPAHLESATNVRLTYDRSAETVLVQYENVQGQEITETWGVGAIEEFESFD